MNAGVYHARRLRSFMKSMVAGQVVNWGLGIYYNVFNVTNSTREQILSQLMVTRLSPQAVCLDPSFNHF